MILSDLHEFLHIVTFASCLNSLEVSILFEHDYEILVNLKNGHFTKSPLQSLIFVTICGSRLWRRDADTVVQEEHFDDF